MVCFVLFCFVWDRISIRSPRCLETHHIDQAGPELTEICLPLSPGCWAYRIYIENKQTQMLKFMVYSLSASSSQQSQHFVMARSSLNWTSSIFRANHRGSALPNGLFSSYLFHLLPAREEVFFLRDMGMERAWQSCLFDCTVEHWHDRDGKEVLFHPAVEH